MRESVRGCSSRGSFIRYAQRAETAARPGPATPLTRGLPVPLLHQPPATRLAHCPFGPWPGPVRAAPELYRHTLVQGNIPADNADLKLAPKCVCDALHRADMETRSAGLELGNRRLRATEALG